MPVPLKPVHVFLPIVAGICLTVFVLMRHYVEIGRDLRGAWIPSSLIFGLVLASMALATPVLMGSSLAYIDWWNGELASYSQFSHQFLGILHDPNYTLFFTQNSALRYGAELFLAALSLLTTRAPLMLVEVVSAFYKVSAIIAFALSLELVRKERGLVVEAVILADLGFAFATILSLNHVLAFFASQAITGSFILLCLGLFAGGLRTRLIQALFAVHVLFIVITYAEALPLLGPAVALILMEAAWTRRRQLAVAILVIFGAGLAANPALLAQRIAHLYRLRLAIAGFDVLGNPKDDLQAYLAAASGFRYPFLDEPALPHAYLSIGLPLAIAAVFCAFVFAAIRLRTLLFLGIPVLFILMHVNLGLTIQPMSSQYYKSYKVFAAFYFAIFFALAFMIDGLQRRQFWRGIKLVPRFALLAGVSSLIGINILVSARAAADIKEVPSVYLETDVQRALALPKQGESVLILADDNSAVIWDLMANYDGAPRILLDRLQAETVYHNHSVVFIEPVLFPQISGKPAEMGPVFSGKIIIPQVAAYSPTPQPVNLLAELKAITPGLRLQERETLLRTTAFREIEGTLVNNANAESAPDGRPNQAPTIVGVTPKFGSAANVTLNFTYSDPNGYSDVAAALVLVHSDQGYTNSCYLSYTRSANQLGLILDGGKAWDVSTLGSKKRLENSACMIDVSHSGVSGSGNQLALSLAIRFKPAFTGRKTIETTVADESKLTTGWQVVGYWDVP